MDNIKNDAYYIQKIRQDLEFIVIHMQDIGIQELNEMKSCWILCCFDDSAFRECQTLIRRI